MGEIRGGVWGGGNCYVFFGGVGGAFFVGGEGGGEREGRGGGGGGGGEPGRCVIGGNKGSAKRVLFETGRVAPRESGQ